MLKMKSLRESLLDNDLVDKTDEIIIKNEIEEFLKANYNCRGSIKISEKPNKDDLYEVSSNSAVEVTNKNIISLTNGMFIWSTVDGSFFCNNCKFLKSLEGAPEKVEGGFYCIGCDNLISLDGAPKEVGGTFDCSDCQSLKSLDSAPKKVGRNFDCSNCTSLKSLKSSPKEVGGNFDCSGCKYLELLEGAPKEVGGDFNCSYCDSLKSLDGAPKEIGGTFYCFNCAGQFTEDDVKKISNVKNNIICSK